MSSFLHSVHEYSILLIRYLVIFTVIGFMPVPLFSFFGGQTLQEIDFDPFFQYFNHFEISTGAILDNVYTNIYIDKSSKNIDKWDIDNAILWTDYLTYQLIQQDIPVVKQVISTKKLAKTTTSLYQLHQQSQTTNPWDHPELSSVLLNLKQKFQSFLPIKSITEDARQWIILALNTDQETVKKQIKILSKQYPLDNFLVVSQTPFSFHKKTVQLQLPQFNVKQAKRVLSQGFKISQTQAQILLIEHEKSLWELKKSNGDHRQYSLKSLLNQNYHSLEGISKKQDNILSQLCENGKAKLNKKADVSDYGVVVNKKNYVWANDQAMLSYELQKGILCENRKWIDVQNKQSDQKQEVKSAQSNEKKEEIENDSQENQKDEKNDQNKDQSSEALNKQL